jgi:hypothetical protein
MSKNLIVGLIIVFCCVIVFFGDFALAASCGKDEVLIVKSGEVLIAKPELVITEFKIPGYDLDTCLNLKTSQINLPHLKKKECIVVKFYNGQEKIICGPEKKVSSFIETLIEMIIRLTGSRTPSPNHCDIWDLDISGNEENFCFESTEKISICRKEANSPIRCSIKNEASEKSSKKTWRWADGEKKILWRQKKFPIRDGVSYQLKISDNAWKSIIFHKVPKTFSGNKQTSWMIDKGCYLQADTRVQW